MTNRSPRHDLTTVTGLPSFPFPFQFHSLKPIVILLYW